ncbi:MAG: FAD-dependent oxidoreductase [Candidatus Woesearchaeota archaeon]
MYDVIIVGGGVSGFAAAMYARRLGLNTAIFSEFSGGTILMAHNVENYPGFESISGEELAKKIELHARKYSPDIFDKKVVAIGKKDNFFLVFDGKENHKSKTIILATGTSPRKLGIKGEEEFLGKGVSYCALCDAHFYKNKVVAVVGGSDTAVLEAELLSQLASKVYIIYRGEKLRAEHENITRIKNKSNIEIVTNNNISLISGNKFVTKVLLEKEYKRNRELLIDGVFIAAGHIPVSDLAKSIGINLNEKGEIIIDKETKTNIEGVFAVGDVTNSIFKQAITGVAQGCIAAFSAYNYIKRI